MITTKYFGSSVDHQSKAGRVLIWDSFIRLFHWGLAASFLIAYITEDDFLSLHVWSGYAILVLVLSRFLWGFVGTPYARWSDFIKTPTEIWNYLKDAALFRADRYIGHNPAGGAMVVGLMICMLATSISGLAVYGGQEFSGPFASLLSGVSKTWAHRLEEIHEAFANLTLLLVVLHLIGVVAASLQHGENLVRSMITGYKNKGLK